MRSAKFSYNTSLRHSGGGSFHCVDEQFCFVFFCPVLVFPSVSITYISEENVNSVYRTMQYLVP